MSTRLLQFSISIAVFFVLTLQLVVGLTYHGVTRWPFISYPMYAGAKQDGSRINDYNLLVVRNSGETVSVQPEDFDMSFWIFRKNIISPILRDEYVSRETMGRLCVAHRDLSRVDVRDIGIAVSKTGPMEVEPITVASVNVSCNDRSI